jgi:hypothetical protein
MIRPGFIDRKNSRQKTMKITITLGRNMLTCFVLLPKVERDKLSKRATICVFLGYGIGKKGYRCYDPIAQKLRVSRNVTFWVMNCASSELYK